MPLDRDDRADRMVTDQEHLMPEVLDEIASVEKQAEQELHAVRGPEELEQFRIKYLGTKGAVKQLMTLLGRVPKEQKPAVGQRVNALKDRLSEQFQQKKQELSAHVGDVGLLEDVTEPGLRPSIGNRHILMKVQDELTELFGRMGFTVETGPEVEDEFHNFVALNIPEQHPARDPLDNFYLERQEGTKARRHEGSSNEQRATSNASQYLLRTQTSTVQIRVMEKQKPPIRAVMPGRVYRPDTHDMTHLSMFHQLEALVVDREVSMIDLKSTVMQFVHAYFGPDTRARFRPSFFPFTEPSAEVDVWFDLPDGRSRWVELGGCGMVHPNVLAACGIDPEQYSGWAFGFGIERIAMRKYAINDIRLFVENNLRFLRQF
jgi:phenylalanyl-tRNA synthetase alpha chain